MTTTVGAYGTYTEHLTLPGPIGLNNDLRFLMDYLREGRISHTDFSEYVHGYRSFPGGPYRIHWDKVYEMLGMYEAYSAFFKEYKHLLVGEQPEWRIPVIQGLKYDLLIKNGFRKLGINIYYFLLEDIDNTCVDERHPANGSYIISTKRSREPSCLLGTAAPTITLLECWLLHLGYFITGHCEHLSKIVLTLCTGTKHRGLTPGVYWCEAGQQRELNVAPYNGVSTQTARTRCVSLVELKPPV